MKLAKLFNHNFQNDDFLLYDKNNNQIYYEKSNGYWVKREFDKNNNEIYFEKSSGFWVKREYDKNNNEIYFENSKGYIIDNRPKENICKDKIIEIDGK